jgi:hypothetical protein
MADGFATLRNEAAVELKVIVPLFQLLGYELDDISPKHPVIFQEGRTGRPHEADFVLFSGPLHNVDTSLVVVEAKSPKEDIQEGRRQAESYASPMRAPILLTCDGNTLEVWQFHWPHSSEKVLAFPVSEIDGRRGDLERYLQKAAVIDYCRRILRKTIVEATADFGRYEDAELRRTLSFDRSIDRQLKQIEQGTIIIISRDLTDVAPSGATIVAPSGLGKTDLSFKLLRSEISRRWHDRAGPVPVHIPLLDLVSDEPILTFAAKRLAPYNASVTDRSIESVIREQGLTLILDEFDRLGDDDRVSRESEIRLLLRDYENLRVFVFSRLSARPGLVLPSYELVALDDEGKLTILQARGTPGPATVLQLMPPLLRDLCSNPLILIRAVDHYETTGSFPNRVEQIFRTWLDHTIQTNTRSPSASAQREAALGILAQQKDRGRIPVTEALAQLGRAGYPPELLDDLVRCDALAVTNGTVSFHHEALADYLRALTISRFAQPGLGAAIEAAEFEAGSLFPVLLMALLDAPEVQSALWRRLAHIDFTTFLELLRYRADVSAHMPSEDLAELTRRFLRDLHEGVAVPLDAFFPALRAPILGELVKVDTEEFDVVGAVDGQSASYSFVAPGTATSFNADDLISRGCALRYILFAPAGLRLDSGRLLGLQNLREALLKLIDARDLRGRLEWTSERLTSRLHYLRNEHQVNFAVTAPLLEWHTFLASQADAMVLSSWPSQFLFSIRSLLDDIEILRTKGRDQLADASLQLGHVNQNLDPAALARALDEHYRLMQTLYREVAEESFAPVVRQLGFYNALPVRWRITVVDGGSPFGPTIYNSWLPVENWDQAGADVEFSDKPALWEEADFVKMRDELQRLGRLTKHTAIFGGGWRVLASFHDFNSVVADTESSPFRDACAQLKSDVERLFSEMPSHDRTPSWDHLRMPVDASGRVKPGFGGGSGN